MPTEALGNYITQWLCWQLGNALGSSKQCTFFAFRDLCHEELWCSCQLHGWLLGFWVLTLQLADSFLFNNPIPILFITFLFLPCPLVWSPSRAAFPSPSSQLLSSNQVWLQKASSALPHTIVPHKMYLGRHMVSDLVAHTCNLYTREGSWDKTSFYTVKLCQKWGKGGGGICCWLLTSL